MTSNGSKHFYNNGSIAHREQRKMRVVLGGERRTGEKREGRTIGTDQESIATFTAVG